MSRLRRLRLEARRVPRACLACAAIAFVNAGVWAVITPPFQVPDEIAHVTYVQYIVEWGELPGGTPHGTSNTSDEMSAAAASVPFSANAQNPAWSPRNLREYRRVQPRLDQRPGSVPPAAVNNPPLYYAVQALPYVAGRDVDAFDRLLLMRLVSALLAAVTVAATFLFVRELLPGRSWAWTVGALAVAFQPMFGFMSGGVNNDNLLYGLGAILAYLVARTMRRGLTPGLAAALALVSLAGMLTKTSFAGLLGGAAFGVVVAITRMPTPARRRAAVVAGVAAVAFVVPLAGWLVANQEVFGRAASTTTGGFVSSATTDATTLRGHLSYIWQVFLPRLPGMQTFIPTSGAYPLWDTFIQGFVGRFGWWHFGFPLWVNQLALGIYVALVGLTAAGMYRARAALRRRWPELLTFALIAAGYVILVEVASYRYQAVHLQAFEQARYLLPLLPLYGGLVAVAATAGGRRWGPALGAFLVLLAMTHSLFAMLLVIGRYYA
jgi:4-amino-4-deoxy-L-arabinose transferase-like glycosyltransferase